MRQYLFIFLICLIFSSCGDSSVAMPEGFTYKVVVAKHPINNVVTVEINKRISLEQLKYLGNEVFKTLPERPKTFIGYVLPGMRENAGAWAITNYDPEQQIEIMGTTEEEFLKKQKRTANLVQGSLGVWEGVEPNKFNYALIDSAGFHLFKMVYPDYIITDTVSVKHNDGETFIYHRNTNGKEFYKINVLDQLVYYNDLGKPSHSYESIK